MKNDIDAILNSMFSGGRMNVGKSKAAEDAEEFLKSINKSSGKINEAIQKQTAEIEALNEAAKADLQEVAENLETDGLAHKKASGSEVKKPELNVAFSGAAEALKDVVIGQDDFLKSLFLAFKRPFVMGSEEDKAASTIIITGKTGTGRHSALKNVSSALAKEQVLDNGNIFTVDLSLYASGGDSKLMIQDLFAALESKAKVILFEHYEKCHKSLLPMISDLVLTGKIQLPSRYVAQKGILVDAGTALVPGAVSALKCSGQYLVFITANSRGKIADTMGAAFINGVSDICETGAFMPESLTAIGCRELKELCEKSARMLQFSVEYSEEVPEFFAGKFTLGEGVNSITDFAGLCYRTLSEYKLNQGAEKADIQFSVCGGNIKIIACSGGREIELAIKNDNSASKNAVDEVKASLDEVVGLSSVKEYIFSLEEHYVVSQMRKQRGLKSDSTSMHMIFTGNPGTGKTTIARLVSRYLKAIGVLSGGQLIEVTRADLVGRFVGHTAPLTSQVIESALGGVLFIDEAYSLFRGTDDSFGLEAIDTIVKGMEDNRDNLVVILAGYSKEMGDFLKANSGLASRFPNIIEFPDYTAEELLEISKIIVKDKGYVLSPECDAPLLVYFGRKQLEDGVTNGNGRMARNLMESAILNQAKRIIAEKTDNLEELKLMDFDL